MPRKARRDDEWSDDEIILAVASCPRERQSYSPRHRNVIELADLIGRSRGAVSHRFANISHLILGGHGGEAHVSQRTRELFDQFRGRDIELQARAAVVRRNLMERDPTPRAEAEVPKDRTTQLSLDVFAAAEKSGLPKDSVDTYAREGSWHFGVVLNLPKAFEAGRDQISSFLIWVADRLGPRATKSRGFDLAVQGDWNEIAVEVLAREAPHFHSRELDAAGRLTLALRLWQLGVPVSWRATERSSTLPPNMKREAEAMRVATYFHIDTRDLCDACLLMLKELIDRLVRTPPTAG